MMVAQANIYRAGRSSLAARSAAFLVKVAIATALIFWLVKRGRLDISFLGALRPDPQALLFVFVGAFSVFFGLLLLAFRLWLLVRSKNFAMTYKKCLGLTLMGAFVGVTLPGLVGGDAMKACYLCMNVSERRLDALSAIVIDRILGIYALLLLGTLVLFISWCSESFSTYLRVFIAAPALVVSMSLGMFLVSWDRFFNCNLVQVLLSMAPNRLKVFVTAFRGYFKDLRLILIVIILSIINHALVVVSFIVAAGLLGIDLPLVTHYVLNPLAMVMNVVPLTPGGIGITETAFSFLYQAVGSTQGATVGLLGRLIQYVVFTVAGSIAFSLLRLKASISTVSSHGEWSPGRTHRLL